MDGPLESWPSFRDVSRQQAEALLGDQDMVFVVRKKPDDRQNPDVFVLTFMTDKTDQKNTMKNIVMFRDPETRAQYRGEPSADSPNPPWYPSVLQFLAVSYQPYGADLRPLPSTSTTTPTLPEAVASALLAAAASDSVPPSHAVGNRDHCWIPEAEYQAAVQSGGHELHWNDQSITDRDAQMWTSALTSLPVPHV